MNLKPMRNNKCRILQTRVLNELYQRTSKYKKIKNISKLSFITLTNIFSNSLTVLHIYNCKYLNRRLEKLTNKCESMTWQLV